MTEPMETETAQTVNPIREPARPSLGLPDLFLSFQERLTEVRRGVPREDWDWYPYHSMSNVPRIASLLEQSWLTLDELVGGGPVLDIGCGDGDIAFFAESLGGDVDALDNAPTNYNSMRGVRALRDALGSKVAIYEQDIDARFSPPREHYNVCFALGLLYHLKNPFGFLETIQKHADYCFLSTRIARAFPGMTERAEWSPAAYLLDADECNQDETNYWIFSDAGLRRILRRTGWVLRGYQRTGPDDSDPVHPEGDQRAFCLLQSSRVRAWRGIRLGTGWHDLEDQKFRWTAREFSLVVHGRGDLRMSLYVPEDLFQADPDLTLHAEMGGSSLESYRFRQPGKYEYSRTVDRPGEVRFRMTAALPPGEIDRRERGLVVTAVDLW